MKILLVVSFFLSLTAWSAEEPKYDVTNRALREFPTFVNEISIGMRLLISPTFEYQGKIPNARLSDYHEIQNRLMYHTISFETLEMAPEQWLKYVEEKIALATELSESDRAAYTEKLLALRANVLQWNADYKQKREEYNAAREQERAPSEKPLELPPIVAKETPAASVQVRSYRRTALGAAGIGFLVTAAGYYIYKKYFEEKNTEALDGPADAATNP